MAYPPPMTDKLPPWSVFLHRIGRVVQDPAYGQTLLVFILSGLFFLGIPLMAPTAIKAGGLGRGALGTLVVAQQPESQIPTEPAHGFKRRSKLSPGIIPGRRMLSSIEVGGGLF